MLSFKNKYTHEERESEYLRMKSKFPERYCIILEPANKNTMDIDKHKYLVPKELTVGQMLFVVRKRIHLSSAQALFFYVNNTLPSSSITMETLYLSHRDEDGFLYIRYTGENTFG